MQIESLQLLNFRNYEKLDMEFSPGVNIIYGSNAQGKTNILESIYFCGLGKSHKGSREKDIIRIGCDEAHIKGEFKGERGHRRVDIHLKKNKGKGIAIGRIPLKKLSELYGRIFIVMFSAEDLDIIKRGPSERRKFMDIELCQMDPIYVENLISYNRILKERHELFKTLDEARNDREALLETLDIWDMQLAAYGSRIINSRREFLDKLNPVLLDIHYEISGGKEKINLAYQPSCEPEDLYEEILKNRERDSIYKQTSVGPHRDDFVFRNENRDMKIFGSNGQQRTAALSLKLSELNLIEQEKNEKPVLLLDDVLSELDRDRQRQLLKSLNETQTIITCTGVDEFIEGELKEARKFYIEEGRLKKTEG